MPTILEYYVGRHATTGIPNHYKLAEELTQTVYGGVKVSEPAQDVIDAQGVLRVVKVKCLHLHGARTEIIHLNDTKASSDYCEVLLWDSEDTYVLKAAYSIPIGDLFALRPSVNAGYGAPISLRDVSQYVASHPWCDVTSVYQRAMHQPMVFREPMGPLVEPVTSTLSRLDLMFEAGE
jgi:hypothetical protein